MKRITPQTHIELIEAQSTLIDKLYTALNEVNNVESYAVEYAINCLHDLFERNKTNVLETDNITFYNENGNVIEYIYKSIPDSEVCGIDEMEYVTLLDSVATICEQQDDTLWDKRAKILGLNFGHLYGTRNLYMDIYNTQIVKEAKYLYDLISAALSFYIKDGKRYVLQIPDAKEIWRNEDGEYMFTDKNDNEWRLSHATYPFMVKIAKDFLMTYKPQTIECVDDYLLQDQDAKPYASVSYNIGTKSLKTIRFQENLPPEVENQIAAYEQELREKYGIKERE